MKIREILTEVFFPKRIKCLACDYEVFDENGDCLCPDCKLQANKHFCLSCGRALSDMADFCDYCKERPCKFTMARAPFVFNDTAKKMVHRLKYGNAQYMAEVFAGYMARDFASHKWQVDEVCFVPMHKKRLRSRGYNQAELIARHFCALTHLPLVDYLDRTKYTNNLAKMSRKEREKAIANALALKPDVKKCASSILLIDDVFTTSTTSSECARLLKKNGATAVYIQTFATGAIIPELY